VAPARNVLLLPMHLAAMPLPAGAQGLPVQPPGPQVRATLGQCLLLALLLHVAVVLWLGNAPGGSAQPGEGVGGTLNIRLQGLAEPGPRTEPEALRWREPGPSGAAPTQRWGGAVRDTPTAGQRPGAAQAGRWQPQEVPAAAASSPVPGRLRPVQVLERGAQTAAVTARVLPPGPALTPAPVAAPDSASLSAPHSAPHSAPLPAPMAMPASEPITVPMPEMQAEPLAERRADPKPAPAPDLAALQVPQALAAALPEPAPLPAFEAPLRSVPVLQPPAQFVAAPLSAPPPLAQPLPTLPAPTSPLPAPLEPPAAAVVAPAPAAAKPPEPLPVPAPTEAPSAAPAPEVLPAAAAVPDASAPHRLPLPAAGRPDAGSQTGQDVATPPSAPPDLPRLNLDLPRPRGGELSQRAAPGVLPLLPRPPEVKSKLERELEQAARPDCRTAHGGAGLLAVVPLVADTVRGQGCRW
jgi:hypothetical protein